MTVEKIVVGYLQENCYIIIKNNKCLIVDPGDELKKIEKFIENNNLKLLSILITHYHSDHIGCLDDLRENNNIEIYDYKKIGNHKIEDFEFETIETKGHSKESVSFFFKKEKLIFTGDFIFKNSIGRMDLEGGSIKDMKRSIKKIKNIKENLVLYPGHGEITTLQEELNNNPYLISENLI